MSAIAGIFRLDSQPINPSLLDRMNRTLSFHGPDHSGIWAEGPIGFSQNTLWNTPESPYEKYPLSSPDGNLVLVADARIDNRKELFHDLGLTPPSRHSTGHLPFVRGGNPLTFPLLTKEGRGEVNGSIELGDGELILRAYEKWGESCAEKLIGDFAFAVWDKRRRALFCARDCFGVRPFYYYQSDKFFAFASEIKALLAVPEIPKKLNEVMIAHHLLWLCDDPNITFYQQIQALPPATLCTVTKEKVSTCRYWFLDPSRNLKLRSDKEYADRFREIFTEAVRCRLRSYSPVGSLLSGGLDSSAVTCVANRLLADKGLDTYSIVFDEFPASDERPYIEAVTALKGIRPHLIFADKKSPFSKMDEILQHTDECRNYELTMFWDGVYPEAKQKGIRVMLDGDGGDEVVFLGYLRLAELLRQFRWVEYVKTLKALSKNINRKKRDLFLSYSLRPQIPHFLLLSWRLMRWGYRPLGIDSQILNKNLADRVGIHEIERGYIDRETRPARSVKEDHLGELTMGAIAWTFQIVNQAAAVFHIEHRYPFHDQRLAEFCLSLPSGQKLYRGWNRIVMRRALEGLLPEKVRWRGGKMTQTDDFTYRLIRYEKETLDKVILKDPSRIEPYYNMDILRKHYQLFLAKPRYENAIIAWQAAMLSRWLENSGEKDERKE